ncbi:Rieske (2Fe-2S) protein [Nesterenkonia haasae]|uniref:Rieske (2Fe-2S) protein n=1 Tax=Nesterenkonia haasae TaxID=2587813 RepID=UPI0013913018|nr:Rieske 2Fe-2S domain-containing protein [Nesterenkonia haasae]NDK31975.1 Rieske 2Fe-2S domain-containing protein [Nesterenkonia haasae]
MKNGIDIGAWEDFPDKEIVRVEVGGTVLGVCRWGELIYAFRNACPHQGAPLCSGFMQQNVSAEMVAGDVSMLTREEVPVVLCPWHRWEFNLEDGSAAWPGFKMRTYRATRESGRVLLHFGRK